MMLDYLSRQKKHHEEILVKYEEEASRKVMDAGFKYISQNIVIKPHMSDSDIIRIALKLNNCLIE